MIQDDREGLYLTQRAEYLQKKEELVGTLVSPNNRTTRAADRLTWRVIPDIKKEEVNHDEDFEEIGIRNFDFNNREITVPGTRNQRINFLKLLIKLWPGNWQKQLQSMNVRVREENEKSKAQSRANRRAKLVREITEQEFWIWWGIFTAARVHGRKGNLWDRYEPEGCDKTVDYSSDMVETRFKEIRKYIPFLWADNTKKNTDPWWQFSTAVDEFNRNRKDVVATGIMKVMDETMSAYRPQTSKNGNVPHISHIQRKPEDLGIEFKVTADVKTEIFLFMEIQRGKDAMNDPTFAEFTDTLKVTSACTKRMAKTTKRERSEEEDNNQPKKEIWLGDSWFSSVPAAIAVSEYGHYIGVVKTNHARYPRKWIEETMKEWPAGSHIVLETTTSDGVDLLAIGYKYNKRKVTCFIATKGAGHTEAGVSYEARWKDDNNNTLARNVPRPDIVSKYFLHNNVIDVGNQSRQHDLRLEKFWITQDGYFRMVTTLFGICVTDAWKGYKHHLRNQHRHKNITLGEFASILAKDCLRNEHNKIAESECAFTIGTLPKTHARNVTPPAKELNIEEQSQFW